MSRGRHGNHVRGSAHPRWNDGRILSAHGYVKVRVGERHPLADSNGYAYEHLLVWVAAGFGRLGDDETLHHVNGDKQDNRIENLRCLARAEHNRGHNAMRQRDAAGRFLPNSGGRILDGREWNETPPAQEKI